MAEKSDAKHLSHTSHVKYAIIKLGGNQHMVSEGTIFEIERQQKLAIDVLLYSDGKTLQVGDPILKDVSIKASILEQKRDEKVVVKRFKSKSRYRKTKGHKQPISVVKIEEIVSGNEKAEKKAPVKPAPSQKPLVKKLTKAQIEAKKAKAKVVVKTPAKKTVKVAKKGEK